MKAGMFHRYNILSGWQSIEQVNTSAVRLRHLAGGRDHSANQLLAGLGIGNQPDEFAGLDGGCGGVGRGW